ncbi:MAG: homoserine O-acetyltransferase [Gammaproteobacteria bacterium]|nr:homoserine O-acetyltransferase [Gammaproteobacteria bacterium]
MNKITHIASSYYEAPSATRYAHITTEFPMHRGGSLPQLTIAYETWGQLNADKSNALFIFTGLSPSAHAASNERDASLGWWEFMIGPGKAIDTDDYFVICMNSLGSCFGSTGPASLNPDTQKAYRLAFPELAIEDIANAGFRLLQHLHIKQLDTLLGVSLGGMSALAATMLHSGISRRLIMISSASSSTAYAIAIRSMQREMIVNDPMWQVGEYSFDKPPATGMKMARKLGLSSYRSADEWQQRFGRKRITTQPKKVFAAEFEMQSYLEYNAEKFIGSFDPNCYLYLSRAMDWFEACAHGEGVLENAFEKIVLDHVLIIGVESDSLFPIWQQQELAEAMRSSGHQVSYAALESIHGHDAFLVDETEFAPLLKNFLNSK